MKELELYNRNEIAATYSGDLVERWISFVDAKPKTIQTYTRAIRQFVLWINEHEIRQPQRADIIAFRDDLEGSHKATTVNAYLMAVKQFFKWTEQEGLYPNITVNVKALRIQAGFKKDYLTAKQVKKLLEGINRESLQGLRDYAILSLMATTGLRTVEVSRANIGDLRTVADFTALYVQGKGRNEKTEYVRVPEQVQSAIGEYLRARGTEDEDAPLFSSIANRNDGERMTTRSISRIAKLHLGEANLISSRLTAHSLRHTAATLNLLNGGTIEETKQMLRHSRIDTTLIYSHALERAKNKSEVRVAKAIFG